MARQFAGTEGVSSWRMSTRLRILRIWTGWLGGLLLAVLLARPVLAQVPGTLGGSGTGIPGTGTLDSNGQPINPAAPTYVRPADTATVRKLTRKQKRALAAADSAKRTERLFGLHVTRPEKAGLLALAPGAGQVYNHRYWKLPLVYGLLGTLGYGFVHEEIRFREYKSAYADIIAKRYTSPAQLAAGDYPNARKELSVNNVNNGLIFYRGNRDLFVLLFAAGYSLQILDAVVDAHLHDFNIDDNLSLNLRPTLLPVPGQQLPATGLAVSLRVRR